MSERATAGEPIYHITTPELWSRTAGKSRYAAPSLESEGFIHCSLRNQVARSLNRFFRDENTVIVLTIDPLMLDRELRYEPADGSLFPHIYGDLNLAAVTVVELVERGANGLFVYPPEQ